MTQQRCQDTWACCSTLDATFRPSWLAAQRGDTCALAKLLCPCGEVSQIGNHPDDRDPFGHRLALELPPVGTPEEHIERLTGHGLTVLQCAVLHGHIDAASLCVERGASVGAVSLYSAESTLALCLRSPLLPVGGNKRRAMVRFLLGLGSIDPLQSMQEYRLEIRQNGLEDLFRDAIARLPWTACRLGSLPLLAQLCASGECCSLFDPFGSPLL